MALRLFTKESNQPESKDLAKVQAESKKEVENFTPFHELLQYIRQHKKFPKPNKGLFQFIANNEAIPQFLAAIKVDDPHINQLIAAIDAGNFNAPIFSDPDCDMYIIYLILAEKISFEQGMTAYAILMAYMQFTVKQNLKYDDLALQHPRDVEVDSLVYNEKLTFCGVQYLQTVASTYKKFGFDLNYEELCKFVLKLPKSEQVVIKLILFPKSENPIDQFLLGQLSDILHVIVWGSEITDKTVQYWVPSYSLIKYFIDQISPDHKPLRNQPSFGRISTETLGKLHANHIHPTALYGLRVKSNPGKESAHGYDAGPFPLWLHDNCLHLQCGSMFTEDERNYIFERLIPQLKALQKQAADAKDEAIVTRFEQIIFHVGSFCIERLEKYDDPKHPFIEAMAGAFIRKDDNYLFSESKQNVYLLQTMRRMNIGRCEEDIIFFLIKQVIYQPNLTAKDKEVWTGIIAIVEKALRAQGWPRPKKIMDALVSLANPNSSSLDKPQIDWGAWLKILTTVKDIDEFWRAISWSRHDELLNAMTHYGLKLFLPFLSISIEDLKLFVFKHSTFKVQNSVSNFNLLSFNPQIADNTSTPKRVNALQLGKN